MKNQQIRDLRISGKTTFKPKWKTLVRKKRTKEDRGFTNSKKKSYDGSGKR